jgi:hypothetical protein
MPGIVNQDNVDDIQLSYGWYYHGFLARQGFSIRRGNNRKKKDTTSFKPLVYQFHQSLQQRNEGRNMQATSIFNFDEVLIKLPNQMKHHWIRFLFRSCTMVIDEQLTMLELKEYGSDSLEAG